MEKTPVWRIEDRTLAIGAPHMQADDGARGKHPLPEQARLLSDGRRRLRQPGQQFVYREVVGIGRAAEGMTGGDRNAGRPVGGEARMERWAAGAARVSVG